MYGLDILCGISKVPLEISHRTSYPYIDRYNFYIILKFQELIRVLETPPWNNEDWIHWHIYAYPGLNVLTLYMFIFRKHQYVFAFHIEGLVQDCSNYSALAMELLQSSAKPSISLLHSELPQDRRYSHMITSSNGIIFRVTGHLCGEFTGPRWIPRTKASDADLWCFLWSAPE